MIDSGIAAVILAAGLSKRMGELKPLLTVGKQPAIMRCISTVKAAGVRAIVVVTGHRHEEIENLLGTEAPGRDVSIAYNAGYHDGMFSSVRTGVSALPAYAGGFFLLPADCCAILPSTFIALAEGYIKNGCASVAHPKYDGRRGHPPLIPALYKDQILGYNGENGLKGALSQLLSVDVDTDDPGILLDMDTPEDYAALLKHLAILRY